MIDVIFPKRALSPRERDTRPLPSDYRPKALRAGGGAGAEGDGFFGDEPGSLLDGAGINLNLSKLEDELGRSRLDEIATLVRALTYGEMMELAQGIWNIRPGGLIDQQSLPMMLHLWSTTAVEGEQGKAATLKLAEQ